MKKLAVTCMSISVFLAAGIHTASSMAAMAQRSLVIQANSAGVQNLGGFHPLRNPTVGAAIRAFGRPSSRQPRYGGDSCEVAWRKIGLEMNFAYYGAGGKWAACHRGIARFASIEGFRANRWRTSRGLQIGDSREQMEALHRNAVEWEGDYWLAVGYSPIGAGSSYPVLAATLSGETVSGFELVMSPTYD